MPELEVEVGRLASKGYFASLNRRKDDWCCQLFNSLSSCVPQGSGRTALEALRAAEKCADSLDRMTSQYTEASYDY